CSARPSASTSPRADRRRGAGTLGGMPVRFVIVGGGPAGIQAATHAARLGAEVTLVEREIMGGAANLWDCIPSKAMIATGGVIGVTGRGRALGLTCTGATLDLPALAERIGMISGYLERSVTDLLTSQEVRVVRGRGTFKGPRQVVVETSEGRVLELDADAVLLSTGSRPRVPDWAEVDGRRVLITRQAYPPPEVPEHLVVIG